MVRTYKWNQYLHVWLSSISLKHRITESLIVGIQVTFGPVKTHNFFYEHFLIVVQLALKLPSVIIKKLGPESAVWYSLYLSVIQYSTLKKWAIFEYLISWILPWSNSIRWKNIPHSLPSFTLRFRDNFTTFINFRRFTTRKYWRVHRVPFPMSITFIFNSLFKWARVKKIVYLRMLRLPVSVHMLLKRYLVRKQRFKVKKRSSRKRKSRAARLLLRRRRYRWRRRIRHRLVKKMHYRWGPLYRQLRRRRYHPLRFVKFKRGRRYYYFLPPLVKRPVDIKIRVNRRLRRVHGMY